MSDVQVRPFHRGDRDQLTEDPWVSERVTLVAEQRGRVAAAAHLLRYFPDERAGEPARDELTRTERGWTRE